MQNQLCLLHQVRSRPRYMPEKDEKAVIFDMKTVYQTNNQEQGYEKLLKFVDKWGKKYPLLVKGWLDNCGNLSTYLKYTSEIRKAIYNTNEIDVMHRQIRKTTKTKGAFASDQALLKLLKLAKKDISKKWNMPI